VKSWFQSLLSNSTCTATLCFDAAAAAATAAKAAAAAAAASSSSASSSPLDSPDATLQCKVDAGLLCFARKDYPGAKKEFESVLAVHPWDATAVGLYKLLTHRLKAPGFNPFEP
jgi:hypothetical protein